MSLKGFAHSSCGLVGHEDAKLEGRGVINHVEEHVLRLGSIMHKLQIDPHRMVETGRTIWHSGFRYSSRTFSCFTRRTLIQSRIADHVLICLGRIQHFGQGLRSWVSEVTMKAFDFTSYLC